MPYATMRIGNNCEYFLFQSNYDFLPIQGILQAKYAQITAIPYFCAVDKIIRDMVAILDNLINKKQAESPKPPACPDNL